MDRRGFLLAGAGAVASVLVSPGVAQAWPAGCIDHLPYSSTKRMAWTVDDGWSYSALKSYVHLLEDHHDLRMTMFVLPKSSAWKALAKPISALAETGRLQLANHTYTHYNLTRATDAKIKQELVLAKRFVHDTFGVDTGSYFRPPYGYINSHVIKVAHDLGFTSPVLWYGSTGSGAGVSSSSVWRMCQTWMTNGRIVIDHANSNATVYNFDRIRSLLRSRGLHTVTLRDAFGHR